MRSLSYLPFPVERPRDFPDGCILGSLSFWAACDEVLRAAVALNGWFDPAQSLSGVALAGRSARDKPRAMDAIVVAAQAGESIFSVRCSLSIEETFA